MLCGETDGISFGFEVEQKDFWLLAPRSGEEYVDLSQSTAVEAVNSREFESLGNSDGSQGHA